MTTFEDILDPTGYRIFGRKPDMSGISAANGVVAGPGPSMNPDDRWCVAVIDETDGTSYASTITLYNAFRSTWPDRKLFLLVPGALNSPTTVTGGKYYVNTLSGAGAATGVFVPTAAENDVALDLFYGPTAVNRDMGVVGNRSDWFTICGLSALNPGAKVGLFVDNSGSMYTSTVQASYNKFLSDVAAAGLSIITVTDANENWIGPFTAMSGV